VQHVEGLALSPFIHSRGGLICQLLRYKSLPSRDEPLIADAVRIPGEKFASVHHYGPRQLAIFHDAQDREQDEQYARRAYELVLAFLSFVGD